MVREYKDSGIEWIGCMPKGWRVNKVNRLFDIIGSGTTPNSSDDDAFVGSINWLQSGDINGGIITNAYKKISNDTLAKYSVLSVYKAPFIIIAMYGASVGNISISHIDACVNQACCVLSDSKIDFTYAFYAIKSAQEYLIFRAVGGGQPNISQYTLRQLWIPEPSLAEQQRIASYLDRKCAEIDSLVELQEQMIAQLTDYKQSVITEAVTKGLNPEAELVSSGIDWIDVIPKGWKAIPFKEIFRTGKGLSFTKADLVNEGIPVISYGQVHSKLNKGTRIDDELIRFIPNDIAEGGNLSRVHVGDFIFADTSEDLDGCGNCVYVDKEIGLYAGYHSVVAFSKRKESNTFLAYLFLTNCWRSQIRCRVSGIKVFSVSQSIIKQTTLILPPYEEQCAIASYLDTKCHEIDTLISIKQQKIETLKEYKKSIIFEAVTGKAY